MTAEFDGNPKTTVIVVYAPTNCADEVEVEEFYNDLRGTLQDVPAHYWPEGKELKKVK